MRSKTLITSAIIALVIIIGIVTAIVIIQTKMTQSNSTQSSKNGNDDSTGAASAVATDSVMIKDFAFSPGTITVKAGTSVTWTNEDVVKHSVTSDDGSAVMFDSGLIAMNETFTMKFDKPGTYHYHCTPHPYMKGVIIVT